MQRPKNEPKLRPRPGGPPAAAAAAALSPDPPVLWRALLSGCRRLRHPLPSQPFQAVSGFRVAVPPGVASPRLYVRSTAPTVRQCLQLLTGCHLQDQPGFFIYFGLPRTPPYFLAVLVLLIRPIRHSVVDPDQGGFETYSRSRNEFKVELTKLLRNINFYNFSTQMLNLKI